MKNLKLFSLFILVLFALASCQKEEGVIPRNVDFGAEMEGEYSGEYSSPLTPLAKDYKISITRIDEQHIRVIAPDFGGFDTEVMDNASKVNYLTNDVNKSEILSLVYDRDTKKLTFTRETKTLGGDTGYLVFSGYKM